MAKESLRERLEKRRKRLAEKSSGTGVVFIKEGTLRFRILPVGSEEDWALEMTHFYLGSTVKGVFSASSIGEPCPIMEAYEELKQGDGKDKDLAKTFTPRKKFLVPALVYEDERGKKIDTEKSGKLVMLTPTSYGEIIDMFLDPDLGDFTDPEDGYDIKVKRTGTGKTDTEYTATNMRPSALPKEWSKEVDLEKLVKIALISYDEAKEKLDEFLMGETAKEEDEPRKKLKKKKRPPRGDS